MPPLRLLHCLGLVGDLGSCLLGQVLHVFLHELHLGVQVSVPLVCILEFFFKLEVLHLKLINESLVLLFFVSELLVRLGKLVKFALELGKLGLEGAHGVFVRAAVVLQLRLELASFFAYLCVLLLDLSVFVLQRVPLFNQVLNVDLKVL